MELLETQDPEKKKLIESSDRHKKALEKELKDMTSRTDKMLTNALIIGGALAVTYFVVSSLSDKKKKKKKAAAGVATGAAPDISTEAEEDSGPSFIGQLGTKLVDQATLMLLNLAREKLAEYLNRTKNGDEHS